MLKLKRYFVIRSAGSFVIDLIAIRKSVKPIGYEVKSCDNSTLYITPRMKKQLEEMKKLEKEYDMTGCFAVRFKKKGKKKEINWVFMKPESINTSIRNDTESDFNFQ